jgi:hypothetical protein
LSFTNASDSNYYDLPEILDDDEELKTWSEMFPKREEAFFDSSETEGQVISQPVWNDLIQIYENWRKSDILSHELDEKAEQLKELGENAIEKSIFFLIDPQGKLVRETRQ